MISEDGEECLRKYYAELLKQQKIRTKFASTGISSSLNKEATAVTSKQKKQDKKSGDTSFLSQVYLHSITSYQ